MSNLIIPNKLDNVADFEEWIEKYELICKANNWDEETQLNNIGIFFGNIPLEKLRSLEDEEKEDYSILKEALRKNIFNKYVCEVAKSNFKLLREPYNCGLTVVNTFEDFALNLKKLCRTAYPQLAADIQDLMCKDRFVDGIRDNDVRLWVRNFRPESLDEAIVLATVFKNNFELEAEFARNVDNGVNDKKAIQVLRKEVEDLKDQIKKITSKLKSSVAWCCATLEDYDIKQQNALYVNALVGDDKVPIQVNIDTGANVSLIREELWMKTNCTLIEDKTFTVIGLNGIEINTLGKSYLPIYLNNVMYKFEFVVVKDLITECIIGSDFLTSMKCDINLDENVLKIGGMDIEMYMRKVFTGETDEEVTYAVGSEVWLCSKDSHKNEGPFVVKAVLANNFYRIQNLKNGKRTRLVVNGANLLKAS